MSTIAAYALPAPLQAGERTARKVLRLEHGANVGPLGHILVYLGVLAFSLWGPFTDSVLYAVPIVILLWLLNYSLTIGVLHMHSHRPLFTEAKLNRVVDVLCCVPSTLSAAEMRTVHVLNHHRFDDGPGDITSTLTMEKGWRAVWYWARYGTIVKKFTAEKLFASDASPTSRRRRKEFVVDLVIVYSAVVALTVLVPGPMAIYYWIPFVLTQLTSGYFAWLTHAPARGFEGASSSVNTVGNWLNFFIFNQGYHSVHHRYPGIHWTEIPSKMEYMLQVEPEVIVPYWVTMNTSWRILSPKHFRNAKYGAEWQAKLQKKVDAGSVRSKLLPWFAWI
jgi:fatty acid desaturase